MRISEPKKDINKFKEILLYILNKVSKKQIIKESLIYKILYFIDFDFYEKYEEQIMGLTYIKKRIGPVPLEFRDVFYEMKRSKDIIKLNKKYISFTKPNLTKIKNREIKIIDSVLNRLLKMDLSELREYCNRDVPCSVSEKNEIINYEAVFYRNKIYSVRNYGKL